MSERFGRYIVKINHPRKLAEDINDYFISNEQNFLIEGCRVVYNKGQKQERELTVNERQDLSYRQKSPKYKNEFEFRFVAMKLRTVTLSEQRESIDVNLNKRLKYLSLVKEKPVMGKHEKGRASICIAVALITLQILLILGGLYAGPTPHRGTNFSFHNMPAIVQSVTFLFGVNILAIGALILSLLAWKYHKNTGGKVTAIIAVVVIIVNTLLAIFY